MKTALRRRAVNQKRFRLFLLVFVAADGCEALSAVFHQQEKEPVSASTVHAVSSEGNHVTDGIGTAHHGDDTVKTEG